MSDLNAYIDINRLVDGVLFKMDFDKALRQRFLQFAIDGYRELNIYTINTSEIAKVTPDPDTGIIPFPNDLVKLLDVAIPINGVMWSLTLNRKIIPTTTLVGGEETLDKDIGEGEEGYIVNMDAGGRNRSYYNVDYRNRRIIVRAFSSPIVYLTYTPTGVSLDQDTLIPVMYKEALESYIRWQFYLNGGNPNAAQFHGEVHRKQRNKLRLSEFTNVRSIYDSILQHSTRGPQ